MKHRIAVLSVVLGCLVAPSAVLAQASLFNPSLAQALSQHVVDGKVHFAGLKDDPNFNAYLNGIARFDLANLKPNLPPDPTPAERKNAAEFERYSRIAFWVNAFNALMVKAIAAHCEGAEGKRPPVTRVSQIRDLLTKPVGEVGGKVRTLREIEDSILRKELKEPLVAFLLYRGMVGGPRLAPRPVSAHDFARNVDDAIKDLVTRNGMYRVDTLGRIVWLPAFLEGYEKDFGGPNEMLRILGRYFPHVREQRFVVMDEIAVRYWDTDSRLDPQPARTEKKS